MALPLAHAAIALAFSRLRDPLILLFLVVVSVAPDFDFALVWGLGLPAQAFHRTFSHSLPLAVLGALLFKLWRPQRLRQVSPFVFLAVLSSHALLDLLCTADAADHGVMLFWPLSGVRLGWPVLVPLYQKLAESPFSLEGAAWFTLLEGLVAVLLWSAWQLVRLAARHPARPRPSAEKAG